MIARMLKLFVALSSTKKEKDINYDTYKRYYIF